MTRRNSTETLEIVTRIVLGALVLIGVAQSFAGLV